MSVESMVGPSRLILSVRMMLAVAWFYAPTFGQQSVPAELVVGRNVCKTCHSNEFEAWEHSSHHQKAWKLLDHPKAAEFAKALSVADIKGASACTQCHGTQQKPAGKIEIAQGNSCESCHGGAGGKDGWLHTHYDFGLGRKVTSATTLAELLTDRSKESAEHRAARDLACQKAGMLRSANALAIAKNCLQCHLVPNEALFKAGHPFSKRFEFVEWAQGEVRHNFLLAGKTNAEAPTNWTDALRGGGNRTVEGRKRLMVVVGQLADLEVSLRIRAKVASTKRGTLGDEANDRILDAQEELEDFGISELKPVLAALDGLSKKSLRNVTAADRSLYSGIADAVAKEAARFVEAHQAGDTLPQGIKIPKKAKGDVFQP